jgi:hypothetical protein
MGLRNELQSIAECLIRDSEDSRAVDLDAIGEALGVLAVSADEIDALMKALEDAGRRIEAPDGQHGESRLRTVIATARALRAELGRAPRASEIAARAKMPIAHVEHALALARVMQR